MFSLWWVFFTESEPSVKAAAEPVSPGDETVLKSTGVTKGSTADSSSRQLHSHTSPPQVQTYPGREQPQPHKVTVDICVP